MDIRDFKAGYWVNRDGFKSFQPEHINQSYTWADPELNILLEKATLKLGELNSFSDLVPNTDMFIRMHVVKEATLSSRIEGTQTNMEEALLREEDILPEKRNDWREVNNYIRALNYAVEALEKLPLSSRLLKQTHGLLLAGVRGEHKQPGEFRRSQNWIGGVSLADALFIPPFHEDVDPLMGDLENFLHDENLHVPHLIKIALGHYQFETIHPFLDGNGRIGRLMITLYFVSSGVLHKPLLYLSYFFEKNKGLYYDNLMRVRQKDDLSQWLKFFLVGVAETCELGIKNLKLILALKEQCEQTVFEMGRKAPNAKKLLDYLFQQPIVTSADIKEKLGISNVSVYKLLHEMVASGILIEITGFKRNRYFSFEKYLKIFGS